ncbi:hypothetical protein BD324DRAFT_185147 [Kockovaella imperatae]|uniref:Glycosyl hydrolase n=1 Tax=Kockovaella imperatae TaxID=4999 RepID=A0A1Y1U7G0_9TREE|nr:hypothetical protein BD324DRAFT_185147 [Kockovaella imperatae]ORX33953.1 hypothetical protein BD324DRAFT_185147 [Kockovaella imperatae]
MLTELVLRLLALTGLGQSPKASCRTDLWSIPPCTSELTCGYPFLSFAFRLKIWNGYSHDRTYSHHPIIDHYDNTTILLWSSAPVDEDSMGQSVMSSVHHGEYLNWTQPVEMFPPAMLDGEQAHNFSYWCSTGLPQRAWQSSAIVSIPEVYAIADSYNFICDPWRSVGAGRVARRIDTATGRPIGDPCWVHKNEYTKELGFENTVYGTFGWCEDREKIEAVLKRPETVPAWSDDLYNREHPTADGNHHVREVTHAIRHDSIYQRFWRDEAVLNSWHVWTECSETGEDWYPVHRSTSIYETNIPDAKTKQFFGRVKLPGTSTSASASSRLYLISNTRQHDPNLHRYPLTIAWSGGDPWTFRNIGIVHTRPNPDIAKETRDGYKQNPGFSYPSAVQVGDVLFIAYSENKENIWVAGIPTEVFV